MITLTRLSGDRFVLNAQLIRTVDRTPDTTIRLTTGETIMVREHMDDVVDRAVEIPVPHGLPCQKSAHTRSRARRDPQGSPCA